ncbi:tetratricopeptide repeat protein [Niveispirillum cyanobacteriorum]|nr:tetratricopeptide repeat protein [Niveispirillum cyanobacteriorum]
MNEDGFRQEMSAGQAAHAAGDLHRAITHFVEAVRLSPAHPVALFNLGITLEDAGQTGAALSVQEEARRLRPDHPPGLFRLGSLLMKLGQLDRAFPVLTHLLATKPDFPDAAFRCGNLLMALNRPAAAEQAYRIALTLEPEQGGIANNLAGSLRRQGRVSDATTWYRRAVRCEPGTPEYHKNLGVCLIQQGQWQEGWPHYDRRCHQAMWRWRRDVPGVPRWDGSSLIGKRILVHFEQGLGDTLQFIRYMAVLKEMGAWTLFECQPTLRDILRGVAGIDELICHGDPLPDADVHVPLMSLPGLCCSTPGTVPGASMPYLHLPRDRVAAWASRIGNDGIRVGINWQAAGADRSIPLSAFTPLASVPGVRLFSLQKDVGLEQLSAWTGHVPITCFEDSERQRTYGSFVDSAAIIANLDLVVSCDSAMLHVAGAMGKPTFLALPFIGDWRWMNDPVRTVWYDCVRMFRADPQGGWVAVMNHIAQAIVDVSTQKIRFDHRQNS